MALTERLAILIDANGAAAVSEFGRVGDAASRSLGAAESASQKFAAKLQTAGAGAVVLGAGLTAALTGAAGKFSDLEQATGAVDSVFGAAAGTIEEFAQSSATSVGLSEAAFKQMTATVGALLQGFGYTEDAAASTSIEIAKLGADLSAAFGGTTEEAIDAIGAALRGETDPIERYGAAFNQAGVQAKIAALGLDTSTAAAAANAKAQASLAIIMERTSKVSGQFARESDTLAHKQQVAAANAENAAAALGAGFAPVMAKVTGLVSAAAVEFIKLDEATDGIVSSTVAYAAVALTVGGGLAVVAGKVLELRAAYVALATAQAASAAAGAAGAAAGGSALAGFAVAAAPFVAVAAAFVGTAAVIDHFVNGTYDADKAISKLSTTAENELIPAFRKIIENSGSLDAEDTFRKVAENNIATARKLRNEIAATGADTSEYDQILSEVTFSIQNQAAYYSALSAAYRENGVAATNLTTTTAGLKNMLDQITSMSDQRIAALDATDAFNSVYQAQQKASGSSRDLRGEQRQLEQSTKSVTEAQRDLAEAEIALFLARLGPSTDDVRGATLDRDTAAQDLKDAYREVADAQRDLNDARKEGDKEGTADATSRLERANLNLRRSQIENEKAQDSYNDTLNSGAESSDKVKDANDRVTEAQERLEEAQYQAEETQRRITEGAQAGAVAVEDYGSKAAAAALEQLDYVQSLKDAGAPQSEINEALKIAGERIGKLHTDYGNLNPRLAEYLRLQKELANFEDANQVAFATGAGGVNVVVRKKDIPGYKAPYDLSAPAGMSAAGMSAGGVYQMTSNVVVDGAVVGQAVSKWTVDVGGAPMMIRPPS